MITLFIRSGVQWSGAQVEGSDAEYARSAFMTAAARAWDHVCALYALCSRPHISRHRQLDVEILQTSKSPHAHHADDSARKDCKISV